MVPPPPHACKKCKNKWKFCRLVVFVYRCHVNGYAWVLQDLCSGLPVLPWWLHADISSDLCAYMCLCVRERLCVCKVVCRSSKLYYKIWFPKGSGLLPCAWNLVLWDSEDGEREKSVQGKKSLTCHRICGQCDHKLALAILKLQLSRSNVQALQIFDVTFLQCSLLNWKHLVDFPFLLTAISGESGLCCSLPHWIITYLLVHNVQAKL